VTLSNILHRHPPYVPVCTAPKLNSDVLDHSLYLACPDLFCSVDVTSYAIGVRFIGSTYSLQYLFICVFVFEM